MIDKKCESECREDLIARIDGRISKTTTFKAAGLIITLILALWGIGYTINSAGVERREAAIQKNSDTITKTREELVSMAADIRLIRENQEALLTALGIKHK
uniref:Uncharacterized protein n=1 Tax=viral metagenome TaxID=1070528 RepID=A0A6M3JVR0_9ZZZZ